MAVTTRGNGSHNSPLIRPSVRTVTGWGNDPSFLFVCTTWELSLTGGKGAAAAGGGAAAVASQESSTMSLLYKF